jgi:hypothetical protein
MVPGSTSPRLAQPNKRLLQKLGASRLFVFNGKSAPNAAELHRSRVVVKEW